MSAEDLIQKVKSGYEAFARGDVDAAVELFAEDVTWTNPGKSSVSGTFNGKDEVLGMWGSLGEDFSIEPQIMTADDTHVVVISKNVAKGEEWESADIFTFEGDKVKSFRGVEDPSAVERAFPAG
jgi:ketosteroid isomerase-like protein